MGCAPSAVIDHLMSNAHFGLICNRAAGVRVAIEPWEVTARYLQPDTMAGLEHVAGDACRNRNRVDLTWFCELRLSQACAITQSQDAVAEIPGLSIRVDIDELR